MPAFQGGGDGFLEARPVPARLTEPVGQGASSPAGGSWDEASPAERSATPERPYDRLVEQAAARHGVDPGLVHALIEVESGYRADAVSSVGAMGLMQLMPRTARRYGVSDPLDPAANIDAGTQHLRALLDEFGPLYELSALAAYNAGEVVVRRHGGIPPYPQTHRFVRRVLEVLLSQRGRGGGD
ncbi:MAG: lytic transglycosylase domain-containing protein [Acidobacteria bacterium]|nr:lytic transglycosylase domain-containing protein [Acidobacteriota bacterium]